MSNDLSRGGGRVRLVVVAAAQRRGALAQPLPGVVELFGDRAQPVVLLTASVAGGDGEQRVLLAAEPLDAGEQPQVLRKRRQLVLRSRRAGLRKRSHDPPC